jgi:hypothetical protein
LHIGTSGWNKRAVSRNVNGKDMLALDDVKPDSLVTGYMTLKEHLKSKLRLSTSGGANNG